MNDINRAKTALLKIWPKGAECAHEYAAEAFRALDDARADLIRFQDEIARLREEAERAKMDRNRISMDVRKEWSEKIENCIRIHDRELAKVKADRDHLAVEVERLKKAISAVHAAWNVESGDFCVTTMVETVEIAHRIAAACGKGEG